MRLRLNPAIKLDVKLEANECNDTRVAPLLFITLIENVFKHGIHTPETPLIIHITASEDKVQCFTSNGRNVTDSCNKSQNPIGGIGMTNLRRRIQLIYGSQASLKVDVTDKLYQVLLTIPLNLK